MAARPRVILWSGMAAGVGIPMFPGSRQEGRTEGPPGQAAPLSSLSRKSLHHSAHDSLARAQSRGHRHPPEGLGTSEGVAALSKSGILWSRWRNQSSERLSNLSRVRHSVGSGQDAGEPYAFKTSLLVEKGS